MRVLPGYDTPAPRWWWPPAGWPRARERETQRGPMTRLCALCAPTGRSGGRSAPVGRAERERDREKAARSTTKTLSASCACVWPLPFARARAQGRRGRASPALLPFTEGPASIPRVPATSLIAAILFVAGLTKGAGLADKGGKKGGWDGFEVPSSNTLSFRAVLFSGWLSMLERWTME